MQRNVKQDCEFLVVEIFLFVEILCKTSTFEARIYFNLKRLKYKILNPVNKHMLKANERETRARCEIC